MKKYLLLLVMLIPCLILGQGQSQPPVPNQYGQNAEQCQDLECVRNNIDAIDSQIVALLGQRLAYVKRAGQLKPPATSVNDRSREIQILNKVAQQAQALGFSPIIARSVFSTILLQSNLYEQNYHDKP